MVAAREMTSAPMPTGPPTLCAEMLIAASPDAWKSIGTCPYADTASQCTGTPWAAASATTSATGCSDPTSLLAQSSVTRATSSASAASRKPRSISPSAFTGTQSMTAPSWASSHSTLSMVA